jgi:serine protease Do
MTQHLKKWLLISLLLPILFLANNVMAAMPANLSIAPMLERILPAIVNIKAQIKLSELDILRETLKAQKEKTSKTDEIPAISQNASTVGSGVIVDANKGYILTNAHVIADAQSVSVTLSDGHHHVAKVVGIDKPSDIALLQINAKNLTAIPLSDSNKLRVGDYVAAIGNPFGLNQTVTSGIVSALGRTTLGIENYENFIQTDASINPGNSGGALVNVAGELVGINTAILAPNRGSIGIGFAIPANMAKSVMEQLIEFGNVKRGILGIDAQDITPELADALKIGEKKGAIITQVFPDSPAYFAGLHTGDIILSVNQTPVKGKSDVINTVGFLRVDSKVPLTILRDSKELTIVVSLSDPAKRKQLLAEHDPFFFGIGFKNFSVYSPIHGKIEGVLVVSADENSNAWRADLKPGDVIISANRKKVKNIDELKQIAQNEKRLLLLNVLRGAHAIFIVIRKEG